MSDDEQTTDGDPGTKADAGANAGSSGTDGSKSDSTIDLDAAKDAERAKQLEDMPALSAADIFSRDDLATEWVPVPEWKGKVLVRALTGKERDHFEGQLVKVRGKVREVSSDNVRAKLCQLTIIDPADKAEDVSRRRPLFTQKDIERLGKKSASALDRIYDVAARLSGLSEKDVEELAGNSAAGSGDSSSS